AHIHHVTNRLSDNCMWPMDTPRKTVAFRCCKNFVLLRIVKVLDIQTRLFLSYWSCWQCSCLGVGFKRTQVMFKTCDQCYVKYRLLRRQDIQKIAYHKAVYPEVFSFCIFAHPTGNEYMSRLDIV